MALLTKRTIREHLSVKKPETGSAHFFRMSSHAASHTPRHSRRALLASAIATGVAAGLPARAAPRLAYPIGLLYARIGPNGFQRINTAEQDLWSAMSVRLGGLISRIEPIQRYSMLTNDPPSIDSENSNVLIARQLATEAGLDHVLLYSSHDGSRTYTNYKNWAAKAYAGIRSSLTMGDDAIAEAHILNTAGGPPIVSRALDAPARARLNPFDLGRDPEQQVMSRLAHNIEASIQADARIALAGQTSIAD